MKRRIAAVPLLLSASLMATTPLMATAAPADRLLVVAQTGSVQIARDRDWTHFNYAEQLVGSRQLTYRGMSDGEGGCTFKGQEVVYPGKSEGVTHEREIATNLDTCVMRTERGRQVHAAASREPAGASAREIAGTPAAPATGVALASRTAWHKTYHEDPPGLDVSSAKTNVTWTYSGGCVQSSSNHVTNYTWLTPTGWYKESSSTTSGRNCSYATTTSNSTFKNWLFCVVFLSTTTQYRPNEIQGRWDGAYVMSWSASKSGDCSALLSFHRTHGSS